MRVFCQEFEELRFKFILCPLYTSVNENVLPTRMVGDFVQVNF